MRKGYFIVAIATLSLALFLFLRQKKGELTESSSQQATAHLATKSNNSPRSAGPTQKFRSSFPASEERHSSRSDCSHSPILYRCLHGHETRAHFLHCELRRRHRPKSRPQPRRLAHHDALSSGLTIPISLNSQRSNP